MRVPENSIRMYYLKEAQEQNWSVWVLDRNINTLSYQRLLSSKSTQNPVEDQFSFNDYVKDPYMFEFLNIPMPIELDEKEIEAKLIENLQQFLMELGKGFSFVARQQRISTETDHYYIELVFYNYLLKCFVLFDLKIRKLTHEDIGQMDMYRRMYDELKKT